MQNYEIESKLNNKVDSWAFNALTNEVSQLKRDLIEAEKKQSYLSAINSNRYTVLERLFTLLAEHPSFQQDSDELHSLKQQL